jgi:hypothetical protein
MISIELKQKHVFQFVPAFLQYIYQDNQHIHEQYHTTPNIHKL